MSTMTPAQRVAAYIQLRDHKKSAEEAFKKSMERVNLAMERLENEMLNDLNTMGVNSLACDHGTVYRNVQISATVQDQSAFRKFVLDNDLWDVAVDLRANKTFVREHMDAHGTPVPGVNVTQFTKVGVRR